MRLHTGESLLSITKDWKWEDRKKLGQRYIKDLAEELIRNKDSFYSDEVKEKIDELKSKLELDGYIFKDGKLYYSDDSIFDEEEEQNYIIHLTKEVCLSDIDLIKHHLDLAEKDYIDSKWSNSIANSRNFLESIMRQIVEKIHLQKHGSKAGEDTYNKAYKVRNFLEKENILETKEKKAIAKIYGLLSETGSHPYIAEKHQARLMRHLSLTISQFVLLRFKGYRKNNE